MKIKILFIGSQCVNKQSQDLACQPERIFRTQFRCQWLINMIKVLSCRFQECLCTFTILIAEASSETRLFRHLSDNVFGACNFGNTKSYEGHLFFQRVQNFRYAVKKFQNAVKKLEKVFCFIDNCIKIGISKLSLWRTRYFSLRANVLTTSPKIWLVNKRDFFQLNFLGTERWISSRCCNVDFNSAWPCWPCCLSKVPLKRACLGIYLTTFSESVISEIQKLWGWSFFPKCLKFKLNFKAAAKNWEKVFFWHNCISTGIVKLSLLRTEYFSLIADVNKQSQGLACQ